MVIYQKQRRLAHRQYCVPLSESRLTRFPPPSKKAFFPSSHIFRVNSKCIIKTLFSSKCSSINFRNSLHLKTRDEKISAPEQCHRESRFAPRERSHCRDRERERKREKEFFAGGPLSAGNCCQTWLRSQPAPLGPDPAGTSRRVEGSPSFASDPPGVGGGWGRMAAPPASPAPRL